MRIAFSNGYRKILHMDLDAFFCAVEELRDPNLKGKPFAVGGSPEGRGVVASCSYPARQYGVRSAMPMAQAIRRCPGLLIVRHGHRVYGDHSRKVMAKLRELTPLVEPISIDEAFLDVSELPDEAEEIAYDLQAAIKQDLELPCSLGVATNKLVAKIANDVGKGRVQNGDYPNAITVIPPGQEAAFLAPLPTRALWGVGPKMEKHLAGLGIHSIGDIARWPEQNFVQHFGKHGQNLVKRATGTDDRSVVTEHDVKSVSKEITFVHDVTDDRELERTLRRLSEGVGRNLRRKELYGSTVKIKIRWPDFTTITRQVTLPSPTNQDETIFTSARKLFRVEWQVGQAVRLIGVGVSGLSDGYRQLSLWDYTNTTGEKDLQKVLDDLRKRYGRNAVRRGF